jgi:NTE family protein
VLSGGGAKGFAHIGALKVLEEAGIPIDYMAGTSMGAIVGGLYAIGYDAHTIDSLVNEQNWRLLLSDDVNRENLPSSLKENQGGYIFSLPYELKIKERKGKVYLPPGMISGQNIYSLFQNLTIGYQDTLDFNHLPIPFACVAADSRSGKEFVFREGILSEAMRASMAIPGVFSPVEKDSMLLIDGGIINNFPVDVVREMGADIVIGVIFPPDKRNGEKNRGTVLEVIDQIDLFLIGQEKRKMNIADTDILITPDLHPYNTMDFENSAIDSILQRGEQAAREKWEDLMALKKKLAISESVDLREKIENPYITIDSLEIRDIRFEGLERIEEADLKKRLDLEKNKITRKDLEAITSRIYASGLFTKVFYRLEGESPFDLIFTVQEKNFSTLDLGIRFDTNDMAAILAHTPIRVNAPLDSRLDATIRLSRNPYFILNYSIDNGLFYKRGISGKISRNDVKIYDRGESLYNLDFLRSSLNFNFSEFYLHNMKLHVGAEIDYFHFMTRLRVNADGESVNFTLKNKMYVNYSFNGVYDNLNSRNFPASGHYFSFKYALHTDNFYQMNGKTPLNILDMRFLKPIRLSDKLFITPELSVRTIFNANDSIPLLYENLAGGQYNGHYVPQQIALPGTRGMELLKNTVGVAQANVRYHFTQTRGIYANLNFTLHHDELLKLLEGQSFFGGSIGYFYNSIIGPIAFELGYSGLSRVLVPFISVGYYF